MRFVSIDGNWTVYLWKLDFCYGNWMVYWWKLDGLLMENGCTVEGTRTVYWRKLNGVDGNWIINWRTPGGLWWKECSLLMEADLLHFGGLKMRFYRVTKPALSWTPSILQLIFSILEARKFEFYRILKPRVQDYQSSREQILRILQSWKCDFWGFMKTTLQGTSQRVEIFLILRPEKAFCPVVKSMMQGYQASCYQISRMY